MTPAAAADSLARSPRVYCGDAVLAAGAEHALGEGQAHHLRQVLRLADGAGVRAFSAPSGEWAARLAHSGKRGAVLHIGAQVRAPRPAADIWLVASPLKKDALDIMVEKASELGAARFVPVICDHSAVHRINPERLVAQATDAAEQCERLDVMALDALAPLAEVLARWPAGRPLYAALERSGAPLLLQALQQDGTRGPAAVLVGPEGGFSPAEREKLENLGFVRAVSLGDTILRAETAAIVSLALFQGLRQAG